MKHPYSIPNHSKEDTLYRARETLQRYTFVSPLYGTISIYKLMRKLHATHSLIIKSWKPKREALRPVTMIQGVEVPENVFNAAVTLVTEWGYEVTTEIVSWGANCRWEKPGLRKR